MAAVLIGLTTKATTTTTTTTTITVIKLKNATAY
jgi:hypothetical protein